MKIELETTQDIQAIAEKALEVVKPYLLSNSKRDQDDTIFDVPGLCGYLKVTPKWIHERTHDALEDLTPAEYMAHTAGNSTLNLCR